MLDSATMRMFANISCGKKLVRKKRRNAPNQVSLWNKQAHGYEYVVGPYLGCLDIKDTLDYVLNPDEVPGAVRHALAY